MPSQRLSWCGCGPLQTEVSLQFTAFTPSGQLNLPLPSVYLFVPSGRMLEGGWTLESENLEIPTPLLTGRLEVVPWPTGDFGCALGGFVRTG